MSIEQTTRNPYPGLRHFRQDEDYLFFGREHQTMELLERLAEHRFLAVVGTSGSGKSSLVRCGLLSELLGGKMLQAGANWEIAVTHPGGNPLALLSEGLLTADLYDREQEHVREQLLATLSRSHFGLVEAVRQAGLSPETNFLLVVDQFEEIFRFQEAGQMQQDMANEFISLLLQATSQAIPPIYVVLTMRSDFIGECGQFEGLAEAVSRGEFLIPRLSREQYKRVIEGPAKVARGEISPRLLQRLLNDLGQQSDQLPCLQHALMRTWDVWSQRNNSGPLDLDDYCRAGRMAESLSQHADEIYASLGSDGERLLCQRLFQALTVQESENRGIRRPQRLGTLCRILDVPLEQLQPIIEAYRQQGVTLLMPPEEVELTEATVIDISHESLMRGWNRLRRWVEEEAQAAQIYRRLSESAKLHRLKRAGLYRDPELGIALGWRERFRPNQAWAQRYDPSFVESIEFLESSQQASIAEQQTQEIARQHELEQTRLLADVKQQQLAEQQRSAARMRVMIGGLTVVALVAALACAAALVANNRAKLSALEAQQQRDAARGAEAVAEQARKTAVEARDALARKVYVAGIRRATSMIDEGRYGDAEKILLELDPARRHWEWGHLLAQAHPEALALVPPSAPVDPDEKGLTIPRRSPDGSTLAVFHSGRNTTLWSLKSGEQVADLGPQSRSLEAAAFSPDSSKFAASEIGFGASMRRVFVWDVRTGELLQEIDGDDAGVGSITFNHDASQLLTSSFSWFRNTRQSRLWDLETGEIVSEWQGLRAIFASREGLTPWRISPCYPLGEGDWDEVSAAAFPPEQEDPDVEWKAITAFNHRIDVNAFHQRLHQRDESDRGVETRPKLKNTAIYLKTRFWSPTARQGRLRIAYQGELRVWLNKEQVALNSKHKAARSRRLVFQEGWNDLLLKVVNAEGEGLAHTEFLDLRGVLLDDLVFALQDDEVDPLRKKRSVIVLQQATSAPGRKIDLLDGDDLSKLASLEVDGEIFGLDASTPHFFVRRHDHAQRVTVVESYQTATGAKMWGAEIPDPAGGASRYQRFFGGPAGDRVVVEHRNAAAVYDIAKGEKLSDLENYSSNWSRRSFTFNADSSLLVDFDGPRARVWDVRSGKRLAELVHSEAHLQETGQTLRQESFITAAIDGSVKVWDLRPFWAQWKGRYDPAFPFQYPATYASCPLAIGEATFDPAVDKERIAFTQILAADDRPVILDLHDGSTQTPWTGSWGSVQQLRFSADGRRLAMSHEAGPTTLWDAATGERLAELPEDEPWGAPFELSRDGSQIATLACFIPSSDKTWRSRIFNAQTGELTAELGDPSNGLRAGRFTADGKQFLGYSRGGLFCVWDSASGQLLRELWPHEREVNWGAFSGDGRLAVSCSDDETAIVWDTSTWEKVATLIGHAGPVRFAQFSPDGRWVVTDALGDEYPVRIWDVRTGRQPFLLAGITRHLYAVAFSPDGKRMVVGLGDPSVFMSDRENDVLERSLKMSGNTHIKVFELETGVELVELREPFNSFGISALAFDAGGTRLLATRYERETTLWNALPWQPSATPEQQGDRWLAQLRGWQLDQYRRRIARPLSRITPHPQDREVEQSANAGPPLFWADFNSPDALDHWRTTDGWTAKDGRLRQIPSTTNRCYYGTPAIAALEPDAANYAFEADVSLKPGSSALLAFGWRELADQPSVGRGLQLSVTPLGRTGDYKIKSKHVDAFSRYLRQQGSKQDGGSKPEFTFRLRVEVRPFALFVFVDGKFQTQLVHSVDYPPRLRRLMKNVHPEAIAADELLDLEEYRMLANLDRSLIGLAGFAPTSQEDEIHYDNVVIYPLGRRDGSAGRPEAVHVPVESRE